MKHIKAAAVLLHVFLPVLTGCLIYLLRSEPLLRLASNYLPVGLWAYAFLSALLIIWEGKIPSAWLSTAFISVIAFEAGQHTGIIAGTGDWLDIGIYFVAFSIALLTHRCNIPASLKTKTT